MALGLNVSLAIRWLSSRLRPESPTSYSYDSTSVCVSCLFVSVLFSDTLLSVCVPNRVCHHLFHIICVCNIGKIDTAIVRVPFVSRMLFNIVIVLFIATYRL